MWAGPTFAIATTSTTKSGALTIGNSEIAGFTCRRGRVRSARMSFVAWCVVVMGPRLGSIVEECQTIRSQKFMVDEYRRREYPQRYAHQGGPGGMEVDAGRPVLGSGPRAHAA